MEKDDEVRLVLLGLQLAGCLLIIRRWTKLYLEMENLCIRILDCRNTFVAKSIE